MNIFLNIVSIIFGLILLFFGRRLVWLAAGLTAFLFALGLFSRLLDNGWLGLLLGVVAGAICAALAIGFIRVLGPVLGFLAGFFFLPGFLGVYGVVFPLSWLVFGVIGGILGALLVNFAFDWGLIILTALMGAIAVVSPLQTWVHLSRAPATLVFLLLLAAGVAAQAQQLGKQEAQKESD